MAVEKYMRSRGITLLELLVVLAIIAVISGMGLAFLSRSDKQFAFSGTRGAIISILRYARSAALTEKMSTTVVINSDAGQMYCLIPRTIGLWHFEDNQNGVTTGAFGYDGRLSAELQITPEGKYGRAVLFNEGGVVDCGKLFLLNVPEGIQNGLVLEAWVYPQATREQIIIEREPDLAIKLQEDGSLSGQLGSLTVTTPYDFRPVPRHRWSHIKMLYQNGLLSLLVNHNLVAQVQGVTRLNSNSTVTIGSQGFPFKGKIDEVRISVYAKAETYQMQPEDIVTFRPTDQSGRLVWKEEKPIRLQFDARGRPAQMVPTQSVGSRIMCSSKQVRDSFVIEIGPLGTVSLSGPAQSSPPGGEK